MKLGAIIIRVLICDDVPEIRYLYRIWLSREDDIDLVGEASNGEEAVAMSDSLRPDVVLLDVQMPQKDGMEALAEISVEHPEIKVIMLTGLERSNLANKAAALGAVDYIEKGTDLGEVADRIRAIHPAP